MNLKKIFIISSIIMGFVVLFMGVFLIVSPPKVMSGTTSPIFGIVLILYGIFRLYRAWISYKHSQ